jgi:hypothetical protein
MKIIKFLDAIYCTLYSAYILCHKYGYSKSIYKMRSIDNDENPIPWFNYPTIDYLNKLDFHNKVIFEYGSGEGTLWWTQQAKLVISMEENFEWYIKLLPQIDSKKCHLLLWDKNSYEFGYANAIEKVDPDVIIIDGKFRNSCSIEILKKNLDNKMIILDNSNETPEISKSFRERDLRQIDFLGFAPMAKGIFETSIFIGKNFKIDHKI